MVVNVSAAANLNFLREKAVMEIVFLGMNQAGREVLEWLEQQDVDVRAVVEDVEGLDEIRGIDPELVVSAGFEHKVPADIIEVPEKGIVNLHPSYLPFNRGAHPYIWPLVEGTPAGVSIHYMNEEIDEGDLIDRKRIEVRPDDTAKTLRDRLMRAQVEQFKQAWPDIKRGVEGEEQDLSRGSAHYRRELDELSELDLDEDATIGELIDRLRGLTYPPGKLAWFEKDGEKYFIDVDITPEDEL